MDSSKDNPEKGVDGKRDGPDKDPDTSSDKPKKKELDMDMINAALNASADLDRQWQDMQDKMNRITVGMANMVQKMYGGAAHMNSISEEDVEQVLEDLTLQGIAKYIIDKKCKNIITMAGAGISTSAGIPDFRSKDTGLYNNIDKYNLPSPTSIFSIDFFKENPEPFYKVRASKLLGGYKPTPAHYFIRLLHEEGLLLRHFTQNIDTLDKLAGIPEDKTVLAHGSLDVWYCLNDDCKTEYTMEWIKNEVDADKIPKCTKCSAVIRPGIVMFGENLPARFGKRAEEDLPKCDLLIILGTSLAVQPFASLVNRVPVTTPRLLINRDKPVEAEADALGMFLGISAGQTLKYDSDDNYRDVAYFGTCDDGVMELAQLLGLKKKLELLIKGEGQKPQNLKPCEVSHKTKPQKKGAAKR
ncbi:NAD-dependent protein deacetylase sirtuin-2-like [Glandiceps talaboti]